MIEKNNGVILIETKAWQKYQGWIIELAPLCKQTDWLDGVETPWTCDFEAMLRTKGMMDDTKEIHAMDKLGFLKFEQVEPYPQKIYLVTEPVNPNVIVYDEDEIINTFLESIKTSLEKETRKGKTYYFHRKVHEILKPIKIEHGGENILILKPEDLLDLLLQRQVAAVRSRLEDDQRTPDSYYFKV